MAKNKPRKRQTIAERCGLSKYEPIPAWLTPKQVSLVADKYREYEFDTFADALKWCIANKLI